MQRYPDKEHFNQGRDALVSRRRAIRRLWLMGAGTFVAGVVVPPAVTASAETDDVGHDVVVSVMEHGANGDGVSDDTSAIHAARDAAGEGGKVLFPPGNYLVGGLTASVGNQFWDLHEGATVKMMTGASEILEINGPGVTVNGGTFDGSNGTAHDWSQQGILITADDVTISNTVIRHSPKLGIYVSNCDNVTITGCTVIESWDAAIFVNNTAAAPSTMHGVRITENLIDNVAGGPRAAGIGVRGNTDTQRVSNISIRQNTVRLPYNQPNQTAGIGTFFCEDWVIDGNVITGGWASISSPTATRATVSNNICQGFWDIGIELPDIVTDCAVVDNTVNADGRDGTAGIIVGSAGRIISLSITGNDIRGLTGRCSAISLNGDSVNNAKVTGNTISVQDHAVQQFTGINCTGNISNSLIAGNSINADSTVDSYAVVFMAGARSVAITGNEFANVAQRVITFAATSETVDEIVVALNTMENSANPPLYLNTSAEAAAIFITDATALNASSARSPEK